MRTARVALLALLAALLVTPPAGAAKRRTRKARGAASKAAVLTPSALVQRGLQNLEAREHTAAISHFTRAAEAGGGSPAYFLLGYAHYQRGFSSGNPDTADKQDAVETVNAYTMALALDPKLAAVRQPYRLYHSLALSYEALGAQDKALDAYKKAFLAAPRNPMLPLYAARLRYRMNDYAKSAANLALSLQRAKTMGQEAAILRLVRTAPMFSMLASSPEHLEVLREYAPSFSPESGALVAQAPLDSKDSSSLRDSVRQNPAQNRLAMREQDQAVLEQLAAANEEFKFRRYRDAINAYEDALGLNQNSGILSPGQIAFIHERIGTSHNKLGLSSQAIRALQRSVQDMPFNPAAHYQLALAYSVSGLYAESMKALKESFRTAPSGGELKRYILLAKTDTELEPVRDLPAFRAALSDFQDRLEARN